MNTRKTLLIAAIGLAGVAIFGVTALATGSSGFTPGAQTRGTLSGKVHLNADRLKFQTKDDTDVVVQTVMYASGGYSGWHTHPGFVLVVVEAGAITIQVGCSSHTYAAGQSFVESGTVPIMARNLGTATVVGRITYVVPKGLAVRRDVPVAPVC